MSTYRVTFTLTVWIVLLTGGRDDYPVYAARYTNPQRPTEDAFFETPLPWPRPSPPQVSKWPNTPKTTPKPTSPTPRENPTSKALTYSSSSTTTAPHGNTTVTTPPSTPNGSSWTIEPVGCYRDSYVEPRPLPELIADFRDTIDPKDVNKTVRACATEARDKGYKFFGIQFYTECWSGTGTETTYARDGISVDCDSGVGKSGANFVYRFGDYVPPCPPCKQPRNLCFPAISHVTLESGANISMRQLRIGNKVRTLSMNGEAIHTEVIAFLHKETKTEAEFHKFEISGGNVVILSPQHLIFRKENPTSLLSAVFASDIKLGHLLYTLNMSVPAYKEVTRISMVTETGVFAPLTTEGTLLVNGVLVSCYATWPSHEMAHFVLAPLRGAYIVTGAWKRLVSFIDWTFWNDFQQTDGISWYALGLSALTGNFF